MIPPLDTSDEVERLVALRRYAMLDTLPEQAFDDLTALAALICETPIALISLVDERRQWFKSKVGLAFRETPRAVSFCGHALHEPDLLLVPDAASDARFADNPLVTGDPGVRFYAGAPLLTSEGRALGTLCVMDRVPRALTGTQQQALRVLSRQVMAQLDLRRQATELAARERLLTGIFDAEPECVKLLGPDGSLRMMNPAGLRMIEADSYEQIAGQCLYPLVVPEYRVQFQALTERVFRGESGSLVFQLVGMRGGLRWLEINAAPLRGEHGEVTALLGVTRDITERKLGEEALRTSDQRYRATLDSILEGCQLIGFDWRYLYLNEAATIHNRRPGEMMLGRTMMEMWPGIETTEVFAMLRRCMEERIPLHDEVEFVFPDGTVGWFDVRGQPVSEGIFVLSINISKRKRAELALRQSEERLKFALQQSHTGGWELDLVDHSAYRTLEHDRLFGYDSLLPEWTYEMFLEHVLPEDRAEVDRRFREATAAGTDWSFECRVRRADGEVRWIWVAGGHQLDAAGRPRRMAGIVQDITERKQAELRVRHMNRVYAVLSNINQTIVRVQDPEAMLAAACRIAVANGEFRLAWIGLVNPVTGHLDVTAHAGADAATLEILCALLEADPPAGCQFTRHALHTGQHGVCNDVARDPQAMPWRDGALERGYRAMAAFPLKLGDRVIGTFNMYAGEAGFFDAEELGLLDELVMDISFALEVHGREQERRRAEEQRHVAEERFRELAEHIQKVFWITDPSRQVVLYVSPAYETIWGRTCASLYESPRTWLDAVLPEDRARVRQAANSGQAGGDYTEVYRITRPDGAVRWIRDRAYPVRNAAGEVLRIVGTAEDITAQKLLEDQFRQAQKMEAIGQLAGGVAHDFNNILAAMMLQAEMASLQDDLPADTREYLQEIKATAERGASLTRQLLTFSRRQVMQRRPLDLNAIVNSLTTMLQRILGEDVRLELNLHPHQLITHADAGMLDQVLMNLVVNGRDAMPGGGRLVIETGEREISADGAKLLPNVTPGRHVCLRVTDTGSGISPKALPHIFEPFFTTKEPGKGTGLGLATVFGIVKQHGGSVQVDSVAGRGTTFEILLPAVEGSDLAAAQDAAKPQPRGGTETILVVEDEPAVRRLSRSLLERYGYTVVEAVHGVEALRIWEQHTGPIHLLLTDMVMPEGIDGRALAARLLEQDPQLKVIFTSGYSADIAGRELKLKPGQAFIQKPTAPQDFLGTVRRCLDS